jgi:tetratricopeptide (TPR) repeat protein
VHQSAVVDTSIIAAHDSTTFLGEEQAQLRAIPQPPSFHAVPSYVGSAPFTGRVAHLAELNEWARSADPILVVEAIGGTGKSAMTWEWMRDHAEEAVPGLAGRLWWSFYGESASMTRFLREVLAYTTRRPMREILRLSRAELQNHVLAALRVRPYVLGLDGFERLMAAYHRFDPSKLRDEEVEPDKRSMIEPQAEEIVRLLAAAWPSKVLISTRLMPTALEGRFGRRLPGVQHLRLPGLTDTDTWTLLARLGVDGSPQAAAEFFRPLGNHPLLIGIVAGLVRDYRPEPGRFDRWLADPAAGGVFTVVGLDLTERRTHILAAALSGLQPGSRQLLGWISVLAGAVSWTTLDAINPFRPAQRSNDNETWAAASVSAARARASLDAALKDLEDRGLLWWDRSSNTYDLHPIIRAYAHEQLGDKERVQANDRVRDHFGALPPEEPGLATSVEDLARTITIFRALIGASHFKEANNLWYRLSEALLVRLGAYATVTELLTPLAANVTTDRVRRDLAIALAYRGLYDQAITENVTLLMQALRHGREYRTLSCLDRLASAFGEIASYAAVRRCIDLLSSVLAAVGKEATGSVCLSRAAQAAREGRTEDAKELLNRAQALGDDSNSPWFEEKLEYWRLYVAVVADESLTEDRLADAATRVHTLDGRRELIELRYELSIRQERFPQALAAAQEHEQLGRNAGIDVAPAVTAFLLAKLGRTEDAMVAVEDALARLPRLHPAKRPHLYLAHALRELGRFEETIQHALDAYQQAWADGPPNYHHWNLRDARQLLGELGHPLPDLPTTDYAAVRIPLEDEIRAFIAPLEAAHFDAVRGLLRRRQSG